MRAYTDSDQMHLVPMTRGEFAEAFSESPVPGISYAIDIVEDEDTLTVHEGSMVVAELYMSVLGGIVVRTAPLMGDIEEMASMLTDPVAAEALVAAEESAARVADLLGQLGAVPAYRKGGRWIPVLPNDRPAWSARVVAANSAKMRLMGIQRQMSKKREAEVHRGAKRAKAA